MIYLLTLVLKIRNEIIHKYVVENKLIFIVKEEEEEEEEEEVQVNLNTTINQEVIKS